MRQLSFNDPEFARGVLVAFKPAPGILAALLIGEAAASRRKVVQGLVAKQDGAVVVVSLRGKFDWTRLSCAAHGTCINPWSWAEEYTRTAGFDSTYGRAAKATSSADWYSQAKAMFAEDVANGLKEFLELMAGHPALSNRIEALRNVLDEKFNGRSLARIAASVLRWPPTSDGPIPDRALELMTKSPALAALASAGRSTWAKNVRAYLDSQLSWQQLLAQLKKSSLGRMGMRALFEGRFSNFTVREVERTFATLSALDSETRDVVFKDAWHRDQIARLRNCPSRLHAAALKAYARQPPQTRGAALAALAEIAHGTEHGLFGFAPLRRPHTLIRELLHRQVSPLHILEALTCHASEAESESWKRLASAQGQGVTIATLVDECLTSLDPFEVLQSDVQLRARLIGSVAAMAAHARPLRHCVANELDYMRYYLASQLGIVAIEDLEGLPLATVAIDLAFGTPRLLAQPNSVIAEARGPGNGPVSNEVLAFLTRLESELRAWLSSSVPSPVAWFLASCEELLDAEARMSLEFPKSELTWSALAPYIARGLR